MTNIGCRMVCVEPQTSTDDSTSSTEVKKILFISKNKITLYYRDTNGKLITETADVDKDDEGYLERFLTIAYSAETNFDSARIMQNEIANGVFNKTIKDLVNGWELNTVSNSNETSDSEGTTVSDDKDYYGLFVFLGTGHAGSQGRIIYNVCQKQTIEPLKIKIKKCDENGDSIIGAQFKIDYWQQVQSINAKTEEVDLSQGTAGTSTFDTKSTNLVKVTITETEAPENYIKAEKVELAFTWNNYSREWKLYTIYDGKDYLYTERESPSNEDYIIINGNEFEVKIKNTYNPPVKLKFYKTDISGNTLLGGAKIKILSDDNVSTITTNGTNGNASWGSGVTSNSNGYFGGMTVYPKSNTGTFKLKLQETSAPTGYKAINNGKEMVLTINYNNTTGKVTGISTNSTALLRNFGVSLNASYDEIKIKNDTKIIKEFTINKKDKSNNNNISGVEFTIVFNNVTYVKIGNKEYYADNAGKLTLPGLKTNSNGMITISEIEAKENVNEINVEVSETASVGGYDKLPNTAKLIFKYNNNNSNKWELFEDSNNKLSSDYFTIEKENLKLTLKDDFKLDKLSLFKSDSVTNNAVSGAVFDIELTNIKSVNGKSYSSKLQVTTGENGNTELKNLVIDDINEPITVTITETKAPVGYKKINGSIKITLERDGSGYIVTRSKRWNSIR